MMPHITIPGLRTLITLIITIGSASIAVAQSDAMLTQYWSVPTYYNPASAGDNGNIRLRGGMRAQWTGIDNAPRSFIASADSPFKLFGCRWGTGFNIRKESYSLFRNLTANLQLGYKFKIAGGEFSIAMQAGLTNSRFKGSQLLSSNDDNDNNDDNHQTDGESMPDHDVSGNTFDLGAGVHYSHKHFRAGLSIIHANTPTVKFHDGDISATPAYASSVTGDKKFRVETAPTLYFTAEGNIPVKNTLFELLPSMLIRSDFTDTDFLATIRGRYNRIFSAGIGYRHNDTVSLILGIELKGISIGYSYDHHFSDMGKASSGSHEIFAGYSLKLDFSEKNHYRHKSIRIM